jgi:oligosaccharide repeat unit polymerase
VTAGAWLLAAAPCLVLLLLAVVARLQLGSWLAPSALFALYWGVGLLLSLLLAPEFNMWPGAPWFVLCLACALHLGVVAGRLGAVPAALPDARDEHGAYQLRWGSRIFVLVALGGLVGALLLVSSAGFPLMELVRRPGVILEIGQANASLRYGFGEDIPATVRAVNPVLFFSGWLVGIWFATETSIRRRSIGLLPILLVVFQSFLVSARTGFIWLLVSVIATYLATMVLRRQQAGFLTPRRLLNAVAVLATSVAFIWTIQVVREGKGFEDRTDDSSTKTRVALLAQPMSFSHWLRDDWTDVRPAWGAHTLGGTFYQLGMAERLPGLGWEEDMEIPVNSNVYTALRQLVEDFSVPGSILVFLVLGAIVGRGYRRVMEGRVGWLPVLSLFYAVTLGSYNANWMAYNSCLLGWLLFFALARALLRREPPGAAGTRARVPA